VVGLAAAFGSGAMTNSIGEFEDADLFLVTGSNTTSQHPLIGSRIINARKRGAGLLVIDPREIPLASMADLHLRQNIGTDVAVLNGLMHVIIDEGLYDRDFVAQRTEGFESLKEMVGRYSPRVVEQISGIDRRDIERAARLYAGADKAMIVYAMGITQHTTGTDNVKSCANLAMLTGHVGRPSTGVNPLRGQNNVQGACDMGALPNVFSGYQPVADAGVREKFEKAWGVQGLDAKPGLTVTEMMTAALRGEVRALYVMGENPMMSDPHTAHIDEALSSLDFLVVQDIFLSETAARADVVLPAASFAEKEGTYTNTERRVQWAQQALPPPGLARPDWQILCEVSGLAGYDMPYASPAEILQEVNRLTPSYAGITWARLGRSHGLQWPCPNEEHPGTAFLHRDRFSKGTGTFFPCDFRPLAEPPDDEYDFLLTTGRDYFHYHTGTMTRRMSLSSRETPEALVEIHPDDAIRLGIWSGNWIEVASRRGTLRARAEVTLRVPRKVVFTTFHFHESPANALTNPAVDPAAKIPEYKGCAVKVRRCA
jgi:formate dehydrogenase alpha subunit